jgi:hypothetical protein
MPGTNHNNLTGAAAIHPSAYIQTSDPGAVGANKSWYDSTTTPYVHNVRNPTNTGWVTVGLSTLATQSDVTITSPKSRESLVYDTATTKWINRRPVGEALYLADNCI